MASSVEELPENHKFMVQCPFVKTHWVRGTGYGLQAHIIKCKPQNGKGFVQCEFNSSHYFLRKDAEVHYAKCADLLTRQSFQRLTLNNQEQSNDQFWRTEPTLSTITQDENVNRQPVCEEDDEWNTKEVTHGYIDPHLMKYLPEKEQSRYVTFATKKDNPTVPGNSTSGSSQAKKKKNRRKKSINKNST